MDAPRIRRGYVTEVKEDSVIAWVEVFPGTSIRTSFPRELFAGLEIRPGLAFEWDLDSDRISLLPVGGENMSDEEWYAEYDRLRAELMAYPEPRTDEESLDGQDK